MDVYDLCNNLENLWGSRRVEKVEVMQWVKHLARELSDSQKLYKYLGAIISLLLSNMVTFEMDVNFRFPILKANIFIS